MSQIRNPLPIIMFPIIIIVPPASMLVPVNPLPAIDLPILIFVHTLAMWHPVSGLALVLGADPGWLFEGPAAA
jgi:hypothetical protein